MSARNTWTVYEIDRETGAINWRLGGKRSDFKLGAGAHFAWQHDARWRSDGALTLFDNSAFPPVRKHSRALALSSTSRPHGDAAAARARTRAGCSPATQGSVQELAGRRLARRLGLAALLHRVRADGRRAVGRAALRRLRDLPGLPHAVGRAPARRRRGAVAGCAAAG